MSKIERDLRETGAPPSATDAPKISILVCTRNRADQLAGTIASLRALESRIPWEAVILNNRSTDRTEEVIKAACRQDSRLRYAYEDQPGLGAARDSGWRQTRGEIIALSDDDCYFTPDFVDKMWAVFAEHPDVGVVGGRILLYDPDDAPLTIDLRTEPVFTPPKTVVRTGSFHGANLAFRRTTLERIGGFDRELGAGTPFPSEDIDAVAAGIWSGDAGLFDPRPVILHHHRRRLPDVSPQVRRFDAGRGAYYAKYVLRPDTRAAYLADWRARRGPFFKLTNPRRTATEMQSALRYLLRFGEGSDKLVFGLLFATEQLNAVVQRVLLALIRRLIPAPVEMAKSPSSVGG
ncbi:glycosyltransferase family 2 protein [Phenylobacterium sp. LjRoot225]|uniref:glycosyltransferase n=1 Tax=Phenylobacterium sp. LjRoot225 TaxID=3342285 RepID=UPI003ECE9297